MDPPRRSLRRRPAPGRPAARASQWRPPGAPGRPASAPSPRRSLAARLHVTKQNPRAPCPAQPLCVRSQVRRRRRRRGASPAPRPRRGPPRGGGRRSPRAPPPPAAAAAAASPNPGPGLLVRHQLRLLGRRRHLSLCGKTRPAEAGDRPGAALPGPARRGPAPPRPAAPPGPPPPRPARPEPTRGPASPTEGAPKLTVWCRVRQTGATLGARGVPASRAALYARRLRRPPCAPRFCRRPGAHGARAPLSRLAPSRGPGDGRRRARGRLRAAAAPGPRAPTGAAATVHHCSRVPGAQQGHLPLR